MNINFAIYPISAKKLRNVYTFPLHDATRSTSQYELRTIQADALLKNYFTHSAKR